MAEEMSEDSRLGRGTSQVIVAKLVAMSEQSLREKIRSDIQATVAAELLPHHRRGALLVVRSNVDFLEVAVAIAEDDAAKVQGYLKAGAVWKPELAQLSDWCVDTQLRFQYVVLQPYVLAQVIVVVDKSHS